MQRIVLAIGQSKIDEAIARIPDVNVIGSVRIREHVIQAVAKTQPDLLIYAEILKTETGIDSTELLVKIKNDYPDTRIVYLAGQLYPEKEKDVAKIERLSSVGIYDIFTKNELSMSILKEYIFYEHDITHLEMWIKPTPQFKTMNVETKTVEEVKPKFRQEMSSSASHINSASINQYVSQEEAKRLQAEVMQQVTNDEENENILSTVYIVSSIKPGTVNTKFI